MGKKKFLNKKKSATFTLVYRDCVGDDDGVVPPRQFTRVDGGDSHVPGFSEDDPRVQALIEDDKEEECSDLDDSRFDDADDDEGDSGEEVGQRVHRERLSNKYEKPSDVTLSKNARRDLIELGFPDDGYDYNQHMRRLGPTIGNASFVPSSQRPVPLRADIKAYDASRLGVHEVNSSREVSNDATEFFKSHVGIVKNPASQNRVLDADVIAALENFEGSQFDSADELEDEFVVLASTGGEEHFYGPLDGRSTSSKSAGLQLVSSKSDPEQLGNNEKGGKTAVSGQLSEEKPSRLLDEQFQALVLNEYIDCDNSDLEEEDPLARGQAALSDFGNVLDEFLNENDFSSKKHGSTAESSRLLVTFKCKDSVMGGDHEGEMESRLDTNGFETSVKKKTLEIESSVSEDERVALVESEEDMDKWDCETVVSTFSNLDNHPGKISALGNPKLTPKFEKLDKSTVIQLGGIHNAKQVHGKKISKLANNNAVVFESRTGETLEEKKARKGLIKEHRRQARLAKKSMKLCFRYDSQQAQRGAATMGPNGIHLP